MMTSPSKGIVWRWRHQ